MGYRKSINVARVLNIARVLWGTLGDARGYRGEKFLREKFSQKIIYPKTIFQEFFGQLFPLVLWPDRDI